MWLAPEDEGAAVGGSDDVHRAVAVEIRDCNHGTNARAVVDQLWHEPRSSWRALIPNRVVNVKHRGAPGIGVDDIVFRDETLSGNEIGNAVPIHIGISSAM